MLPPDIAAQLPPSVLTRSQKRQIPGFMFEEHGRKYELRVTVRHDDECGNGHNTFSIVGNVYECDSRGTALRWYSGGRIHDTIAKHAPEFIPLIKWHTVSTDGPMHYVANTVYHASNRDHNGLLKGETRQIRNGKTGKLAWKRQDVNLPLYVDADEKPADTVVVGYEPWCQVGKGKDHDFAAARDTAVWPEATDKQLSLPKAELTALLLARLPALMAEFKAAVEAFGFVY
jgi:hypothetical protein